MRARKKLDAQVDKTKKNETHINRWGLKRMFFMLFPTMHLDFGPPNVDGILVLHKGAAHLLCASV